MKVGGKIGLGGGTPFCPNSAHFNKDATVYSGEFQQSWKAACRKYNKYLECASFWAKKDVFII